MKRVNNFNLLFYVRFLIYADPASPDAYLIFLLIIYLYRYTISD